MCSSAIKRFFWLGVRYKGQRASPQPLDLLTQQQKDALAQFTKTLNSKGFENGQISQIISNSEPRDVAFALGILQILTEFPMNGEFDDFSPGDLASISENRGATLRLDWLIKNYPALKECFLDSDDGHKKIVIWFSCKAAQDTAETFLRNKEELERLGFAAESLFDLLIKHRANDRLRCLVLCSAWLKENLDFENKDIIRMLNSHEFSIKNIRAIVAWALPLIKNGSITKEEVRRNFTEKKLAKGARKWLLGKWSESQLKESPDLSQQQLISKLEDIRAATGKRRWEQEREERKHQFVSDPESKIRRIKRLEYNKFLPRLKDKGFQPYQVLEILGVASRGTLEALTVNLQT